MAVVDAGLDFPLSPKPGPCGIGLNLPRFKFSLNFIGFSFPKIPLPFFGFKLTCDLSSPIDVTAGLSLPFGGGRTPNIGPDPDDNDAFP